MAEIRRDLRRLRDGLRNKEQEPPQADPPPPEAVPEPDASIEPEAAIEPIGEVEPEIAFEPDIAIEPDPDAPPEGETAAEAATRAAVERQRRLTEKTKKPKPLKVRGATPIVRFDVRVKEIDKLIRSEMAKVVERGHPVVIGPFAGEVGFELLYWIPLVRWTLKHFPELEGRLIVVSRGGVHNWYSGLSAQYVDVFDVYSREELLERRETLKQRRTTEFETEMVERVRDHLGLEHVDAIHPSLLFNSYYRILKVDQRAYPRSIRREDDGTIEGLLAVYETLPKPEIGSLEGVLPEDFVAVRFYFRPSFPDTEENREFCAKIISTLADKTNVVLLNNRIELDDHYDFDHAAGGKVIAIHELMDPLNNLHVQSAALSRARAFVGTYGGLAYLAPFYKVPSLGFSSDTTHTLPWHLDLAQRLSENEGFGPLVSAVTEDLPLLELVTNGSSPGP